jgi:hypothetical protein
LAQIWGLKTRPSSSRPARSLDAGASLARLEAQIAFQKNITEFPQSQIEKYEPRISSPYFKPKSNSSGDHILIFYNQLSEMILVGTGPWVHMTVMADIFYMTTQASFR